MGGSVDLFILLKLSGDSVGAPLLVLAVILAGLAALAAEAPHDTRETRDLLASSFLSFTTHVNATDNPSIDATLTTVNDSCRLTITTTTTATTADTNTKIILLGTFDTFTFITC